MSLTPVTASQFIDRIIADARQGYEFVPLIGSGFSAPSGILTGQDFTDFLAYTTYLVLAEPAVRPEGDVDRWDLSSKGWPPYPNPHEVQNAKDWIEERFTAVCAKLQLDIDYGSKGKGSIKALVPKLGSTLSVSPDLAAILNRPLIPSILRSPDAGDVDNAVRRLLAALVPEGTLNSPVHRSGLSPTSEEYIIEQGIRSLHDWRTTLQFLAGVTIAKGRLVLSPPERAIIDKFNVHITRDRKPNLGHKILAHLAAPLHIRLVLTTNFDTLIEDAFAQFSLRLADVPVSIRGGLPDPQVVRAHNSIIKLHGERLETRADLSLDEDPTPADKAIFAAYLTDSHLAWNWNMSGSDLLETPRAPPLKRLLVIGYSGTDARCIQLLKYLLDIASTPGVRVYWVCFNQADVDRVTAMFSEANYPDCFAVHLTPRPDLLLYELYQKLILCLPPGGLTYEFSHNVPPLREPEFEFASSQRNDVINLVRDGMHLLNAARCVLGSRDRIAGLARDCVVQEAGRSVTEALDGKPRGKSPLGRYFAVDNPPKPCEKALHVTVATGAARALRVPFIAMASRGGRHALWFELQDYPDVDSLAKDIFRVIFLRVGRFQLQHTSLYPLVTTLREIAQAQHDKNDPMHQDAAKYIAQIMNRWKEQLGEFGVDPSRWVLFLYGRDVPGANSGWLGIPWDNDKDSRAFALLLQCVTETGFKVVYTTSTKGRSLRKSEAINDLARAAWLAQPARLPDKVVDKEGRKLASAAHADYCIAQHKYPSMQACLASPTFDDPTDKYAVSVSEFARSMQAVQDRFAPKQESGNRRARYAQLRFLYGLTLFRQSRHASAVFSDGVYQCPFRFTASGIDNDWLRAAETAEWIEELRKTGVLYEKPGGYLWMHRDARLGLQRWLEGLWLFDGMDMDVPDEARNAFLGEVRARAHLQIGDWYFKAFAASGHVTPFVECVFHRLQAAFFAPWLRPRHLSYEGIQLLKERMFFFRSALLDVSKVLVLARVSVKKWLASPTASTMWSRAGKGGLDQLEKELLYAVGALNANIKKQPTDVTDNATIENQPMDETDKTQLQELVLGVVAELEDLGRAILSEGGGLQQKHYMPVAITVEDSKRHVVISHELTAVAAATVGAECEAAFTYLDASRVKWYIDEVETRQRLPGYEEELAAHKAEWLGIRGRDPAAGHALVWLLSEYAYLLVRRAKLEYHARGTVATGQWQKVCVACNVGMDICRHLSLGYLREEMALRIKLHELYALGLANLARFFEAHRHLNEASALLTSEEGPTERIERAILCLRRAEVLLSLCYWVKLTIEGIKNTPFDKYRVRGFDCGHYRWRFCDVDLGRATEHSLFWNARVLREIISGADTNVRIVSPLISECLRNSDDHDEFNKRLAALLAATLDDAWNELDRAEAHLAGTSHSALWWGRLATLRLRIYGELPSDKAAALSSLAFRKEYGDDAIARWFERGARITALDAARRLRIVRYFLAARAKYSKLFKKREALAKQDAAVTGILGECEIEIEKMGKPELLNAFFCNVNDAWNETPRGPWTQKEEGKP